jgi:hypothetical protein
MDLTPGRGALALAAVVLGLAGCGGSSGTPSSTGTTVASSTTATTNTPTTVAATATATTPPPPTSAKVTPPGTTLKPGQSAIVDFDTTNSNGSAGPTYKLQVTIESITPGSRADLKGLSLIGVPAKDVPTYVKVRMTNLSHQAIDPSNLDPANAVQGVVGNNLEDNLIITGYFAPCPDADTPKPFAAGQSFNTCETYMAAAPVAKIGYNGSSATLDSPIIWTR